MAQPPHFEIDCGIYFVTTRLKEKGDLLSEDEAGVTKKIILRMVEEKELVAYAYVIMPDHLHALLKPTTFGISKTMKLIKGRTARMINLSREAKASPTRKEQIPQGRGDFSRPTNVWQKGFFDFTIQTERKFREKFNYIHYNPVKRGLVERAEDYKYSSAMDYKTKYGVVFYE
jgi:REP element-mobilizing transposase RayT